MFSNVLSKVTGYSQGMKSSHLLATCCIIYGSGG